MLTVNPHYVKIFFNTLLNAATLEDSYSEFRKQIRRNEPEKGLIVSNGLMRNSNKHECNKEKAQPDR